MIFIKEAKAPDRHPGMKALIDDAQRRLIRRSFASSSELVAKLYASLVEYLEVKHLIRTEPFDMSPCAKVTIDDLDYERMTWFIRTARRARRFPLSDEASPVELLEHLNLLNDGRLTNAAVLLFGKKPQRALISSEVKCAHFHGMEVAKPIPSYQVYKGTVFEMVDQAVDFVLSKIALSVGTRELSTQAPVKYEIPQEVVTEAIVNAVAHRDYTSNGSVQVMLFSDRLEVWNPGRLPPSLTLEKLRVAHGSVPGNPLLAESLYLTKYIERMGTGTRDMIRRCVAAGLPELEFAVTDGFVTTIWREIALTNGKALGGQVAGQVAGQVTGQVTDEVSRVVFVLHGERTRRQLQSALQLKGRDNFEERYLKPAIEAGYIALTIPDKPRSRLQKYRLTEKGRILIQKLQKANQSQAKISHN